MRLYSLILAIILFSYNCYAGKLVLKIEAGNKLDKSRTVQIKSNLPTGVGTNAIINLDGLNLGYDVKNDVYYVHKKIELAPKEIVSYRVEIKDIWVIQEEKINALQKQAERMVNKLKGTDYFSNAGDLKEEIQKDLDRIYALQSQNSIKSGVNAIQHIRIFNDNMELLEKTLKDVGYLEALVLGTGQDPGKIMGRIRGALKPDREFELQPDEYGIAVIRITIRNISPTDAREIDVRRDLPQEIKAQDVIDAGELGIGTDFKRGICFVYKNGVKLEPEESISFDVKIRDKWNVNGPRIEILMTDADNLLARVSAKKKYKSIEEKIRNLISLLEGIRAQDGPEALNDKYVAFYRGQANRLDDIEQALNDVKALLRPIEKTSEHGFKVKAPSMKTTWLIIYIILGFLAVVSLLFFFRWFGRASDEKMSITSQQDTDNL